MKKLTIESIFYHGFQSSHRVFYNIKLNNGSIIKVEKHGFFKIKEEGNFEEKEPGYFEYKK